MFLQRGCREPCAIFRGVTIDILQVASFQACATSLFESATWQVDYFHGASRLHFGCSVGSVEAFFPCTERERAIEEEPSPWPWGKKKRKISDLQGRAVALQLLWWWCDVDGEETRIVRVRASEKTAAGPPSNLYLNACWVYCLYWGIDLVGVTSHAVESEGRVAEPWRCEDVLCLAQQAR